MVPYLALRYLQAIFDTYSTITFPTTNHLTSSPPSKLVLTYVYARRRAIIHPDNGTLEYG